MAITKDQIFETADELAAAGQTPTLANVRKAVGGGSFTTISEAMSEWRGARQAATAPLREPAPQAIAERLADLGADVWVIALELANGRLKAEREALESARVEMETQNAEAAELADQMAAEIEQLRGRCGEIEERARAEREGAEEVRRQLSSMVERAQAAEVRTGELEARATDLNKELERVHVDLGAERERAAAERAKAEKMEQSQQAELARVHREAETEHARHQQEAAQLRDELERHRTELASVKAKAEAEQQQHAAERKRAAEEAHRVAECMTKAEADRDEARKEAQRKAVENSRLIGELEALKTQVKEQTAIIRGIAAGGERKAAKKTE